MTLPRPAEPDALRPGADAALAAWAARVEADHEQVERCREVADPTDFYAPVATRFRMDPRRQEDVLDILRRLAQPDDTWLDIGSGGGRYALPLALDVARVVAIDPSPAMLEVLADGMREHGIANITPVEGRWPAIRRVASDVDAVGDADVARDADVALMAHVGYDIGAIGAFLDAAEAAARRLCVAVMGEGAMTTVATLFWEPVHGEPRVALPALPELVALLFARGCLPEVSLTRRAAPTFPTLDELVSMARRQLWVRPGSPKDARLEELIRARATERAGAWALDWSESRIGVVSWTPALDPA
jgi:SAM-dependent methyltransferase